MSDNTNDQKPAHGFIPVGFGSKMGALGAMLMALAATLTTMLPGDQQDNTQLLVKLGAVLAGVTIAGRVLQAVAEILKGYERSPKIAVVNQPASTEAPVVDQSSGSNTDDEDGKFGASGVEADDLAEISLEHEQSDHHQGD